MYAKPPDESMRLFPSFPAYQTPIGKALSLVHRCSQSQKAFTSHTQSLKSDDDHVRLVSKHRIDLLVRLILTVSVVALLVGPSAVLFLVPEHSTLKICLILVFTLLFSAAISAFTKAKRHEMLAATATYAAVLVVFLGNFQLGAP